jgi:hypothetical protein
VVQFEGDRLPEEERLTGLGARDGHLGLHLGRYGERQRVAVVQRLGE